MSRKSKAAKNAERAKQFSAMRKSGGKGPAKTTPLHGKKNVTWKKKETQDARHRILNKGHGTTVLEKLKAGEGDKIKAS